MICFYFPIRGILTGVLLRKRVLLSPFFGFELALDAVRQMATLDADRVAFFEMDDAPRDDYFRLAYNLILSQALPVVDMLILLTLIRNNLIMSLVALAKWLLFLLDEGLGNRSQIRVVFHVAVIL
jgi:hypothetical protein